MAWYNTSIFGGEPDEFQKQLNARAAAAEARATAPGSNRNRTISAINNFLPNLEKSVFGTERPQAIPTAAEPPSTPSPYTTEERGRRANARYAQDTKQMASFTPNERVGLAMRRGDMGEPMFDDSSIAAGGYDRMKLNTYDPQKAVGLTK